MSASTLTGKGQTPIPKDIRKRLNPHPGDRLEFVIDEDGRVLVLPVSIDAAESAGMFKQLARPVSEEGMNRAIRNRGAVDDRSRHRTSRDHHDWDERTHWDRSEQAASRAGAIDGGAVEKGAIPPKWDGKAAERIVEHMERLLAR